MVKKKLITLALALGMLTTYSTSALAGIWSSPVNWGAQIASYAPDSGTARLYEYVDSSGFLVVSPKMNPFKFTSAAITAIKDYRDDLIPYYYTADISVSPSDTTVDARTTYATNLPNPHYDKDDDGGNGYEDETEVVSLDCQNMNTTTSYYYEPYFTVVNTSGTSTFEFGSQESMWQGSEYNAMYTSPHTSIRYPWY